MIDQRLVTFLTVCSTKNFTKAAGLLNLTQPAVTKHIQYLENYYGSTLFRQQGRQIHLTEAGRILYEFAQDLEAKAAVLERRIQNSRAAAQRYSIGATLTIGEYILPYILGEYKAGHPDRDILMRVHNTVEITKKLLNGEIDLGLVEGPFDKRKFCFMKLMDDELVLAAAPRSGLAQQGEVEFLEVLQSKLILREAGSGTRKVLEDKVGELGYPPNRLKAYMEIGSLGAIKSLVRLDLGYTIISKSAIANELNAGSLVSIPIKGVKIMREFNFIYQKESPAEFVSDFTAFATASTAAAFNQV
jgi:DNA-binding transcriptional LysR family regulator